MNGNSYFSAQIYDLTHACIAYIPFQYGYGSHPRHTVIATVQSMLNTHEHAHEVARTIHFGEQTALKQVCKEHGERPSLNAE